MYILMEKFHSFLKIFDGENIFFLLMIAFCNTNW